MSSAAEQKVRQCIEQLQRSGRGMKALEGVHRFLDKDGWSLDSDNQRAVLELIFTAFQGSYGTVLFMLEEAKP